VNALIAGMRQEMRSHQTLAALGKRQYGVVSGDQLRQLGYSTSAIRRAKDAGRLHRIHRGAYAIGHVDLSEHGRCLAAALACGSDALLSHASAAWLWNLFPTCPSPIHVTVSTRGHRVPSICLHHAPAVSDEDRALREGIPVTALPRTLLDLAATVERARLERAIERSEQLGIFDLRAVEALLTRIRGHHGCGRLRRALRAYRDPAFTRSELERRFLALAREAGLPRPSVNTFVADYEIDMYWPRERFAVELDGYEHHRTRAAFERDRLRQEDLKLAGIEMIRVTATRVAREPEALIGRVRKLLAQRRCELDRP
jgi:very-short-patch-repair endonuclease